MRRTFRVNANFFFEYARNIGDDDDPRQARDIDQELFEVDPMELHEKYEFIHCEVDVEDITNMTTPEENDVTDMSQQLGLTIRDWWSNHCEQNELHARETEIATQRGELVDLAEVLVSQINEFTESYSRHLMFEVCDDCFVVLVWNPDSDSHTVTIMRDEFGGES